MKIKNLLIAITMLFSAPMFALNYYVSATNGANTNDGTTVSKAYRTIQKASDVSQAGDTIFIMNGTYTNPAGTALVTHKKSGLPSKWIVFKNYQNHKPVLFFNSWHCFKIEGSYIEISGLTIKGNNSNITEAEALNQPESCKNPSGTVDSKFNGNGIYTDGRAGNRVHHLRFRNCTIYDCGGSGIQTVQSDYVTIENNIVYNNAWYSIYAPSGISVYQAWNFDQLTTTKIIVRNNICYGNKMLVPWPATNCTFTDGNGIIIDDSKNTQGGSAIGAYKGRTLVYNNICYNNGGSGIHSFVSEHVDIINNTAYQNSQTATINNGEIYPSKSNDVRIFNNILWSKTDKKLNSNLQNTNIVYDYNLHFGGVFPALNTVNITKGDPLFKNLAAFDFSLAKGSPAIDKGIATLSGADAPLLDFLGKARPLGTKPDLGAYEFDPNVATEDRVEDSPLMLLLSPNPMQDMLRILVLDNNQNTTLTISDVSGKTIFTQKYQTQDIIEVETTHFSAGIYFVNIAQGNFVQTKKMVKI